MNGGSKVTYDDITVGLPALLICVEGVIFMVGNHFIFNAKGYRIGKDESGPSHNMLQAILNALNPMDLIQGIGQAFGSFRGRKE